MLQHRHDAQQKRENTRPTARLRRARKLGAVVGERFGQRRLGELGELGFRLFELFFLVLFLLRVVVEPVSYTHLKFGTDARAVYPKLSTRLALSERGGGRPYALLMREGLMPYAEVVLGSKRLCASAKRCTVLAFLAATASTLLAFYLTFVGAYSVLTPFSLLIYVLLWSLSALVDALLSDRY